MHIHHTMRGIFIGGKDDRMAEGCLKIKDKFYYQNEGHCQVVGGPKSVQVMGGRRTVKMGPVTRQPKLDETKLYSLRKDLTNIYEQLGEQRT